MLHHVRSCNVVCYTCSGSCMLQACAGGEEEPTCTLVCVTMHMAGPTMVLWLHHTLIMLTDKIQLYHKYNVKNNLPTRQAQTYYICFDRHRQLVYGQVLICKREWIQGKHKSSTSLLCFSLSILSYLFYLRYTHPIGTYEIVRNVWELLTWDTTKGTPIKRYLF